MEFTGLVVVDIPMEEGVSRAGNQWRKKCWVLETLGQYPKKVKIDIFGNNVDNVHLQMGKIYTVSVDAESREFNGRWYTDLRCYGAREAENSTPGGNNAPGATSQPMTQPFAPNDPFAPSAGAPGAAAFEDSTDDLPF